MVKKSESELKVDLWIDKGNKGKVGLFVDCKKHLGSIFECLMFNWMWR